MSGAGICHYIGQPSGVALMSLNGTPEPELRHERWRADTLDTENQRLRSIINRLVEANIANLSVPEWRFVNCFTHQSGHIPDYWKDAIAVLEEGAMS